MRPAIGKCPAEEGARIGQFSLPCHRPIPRLFPTKQYVQRRPVKPSMRLLKPGRVRLVQWTGTRLSAIMIAQGER